MVIQITVTRNECFLIKEMLPIWKKYADGFVFMVDSLTTDDTREYLHSVKEQYNILEIFDHDWKVADPHESETYGRQRLFDAAVKYSNNIICLDTDEYIDGTATKEELEQILIDNPNTTCMLKWIQYTDKNNRRVDSVWRDVFHDRVGNFNKNAKFGKAFSHTGHLPNNPKAIRVDPNHLFVAHLQWLDKRWVGIKQYFWKVLDYVHHLEYNVNIIKSSDYDVSVNNFAWIYEPFNFPLQIREDIYSTQSVKDNYKLQYIIDSTQKYNIPNLGDWGMGIYEYAIKQTTLLNTNTEDSKMYFCTAADSDHYRAVINLIGSIHKHNFNDIKQIAVFNLGLRAEEINQLNRIKKVRVYEVEKKNPLIVEPLYNGKGRWIKGLFSWKPVVIKQALQMFPHVLYADAGTTFQKPLNDLFEHILSEKYFLTDCGHSIKWMTTKHIINKLNLNDSNNSWLLNDNVSGIDAGFMGLTKELEKTFIDPVYNLCDDIHNFLDDATCPDGWGTARHDQTLFSIQAQTLQLKILGHDRPIEECILLPNTKKTPFHITHMSERVNPKTYVFRCRRFVAPEIFNENIKYIKQK